MTISMFIRPCKLALNMINILKSTPKYLNKTPHLTCMRRSGHYIPPSQYDYHGKIQLLPSVMLKEHWEVWPVVICAAFTVTICILAILSALRHKVDVVFSTHNRENISRTMDMRCPEVHKLVIIHQRYEPWPEMADALDKMKEAERKALIKATKCNVQI